MDARSNDIICGVYFPGHNRGLALFDVTQIEISATHIAAETLRRQGLKCDEAGPSQRGGGGLFWETIKFLWAHRDIIGIIVSFLKVLAPLARRFVAYTVAKKSAIYHPRMVINVTYDPLPKEYPTALGPFDKAALLFAAASAKNSLAIEYPLFKFDMAVNLSLKEYNFSARMLLTAENMGKLQFNRMLKRLTALKVIAGTSYTLGFQSKIFIVKTMSAPSLRLHKSPRPKKYYLLLSNNVLAESWLWRRAMGLLHR